jgi:hypothetical protein
VEVRDDVVGVVQLDVERRHRQDDAGQAADGEHEDEADANSIGVSKVIEPRHIVAIQLKIFTPVGHRDQHRRVHEEQLPGHRHAGGEHVVGPDDERQDRDRAVA